MNDNSRASSPAALLRSAGRAVVRVVRAVIWWFDSVLGGNDYQRYVRHLRLHHPGGDIPSEREYWRERHDAATRNPQQRCC